MPLPPHSHPSAAPSGSTPTPTPGVLFKVPVIPSSKAPCHLFLCFAEPGKGRMRGAQSVVASCSFRLEWGRALGPWFRLPPSSLSQLAGAGGSQPLCCEQGKLRPPAYSQVSGPSWKRILRPQPSLQMTAAQMTTWLQPHESLGQKPQLCHSRPVTHGNCAVQEILVVLSCQMLGSFVTWQTVTYTLFLL